MSCLVGRSWRMLPLTTSKKPRWMGKTGETPSNWDQASTSSCLANKINCFPPDDECSPCFAPPLQGHRGSLGIKGGYFAHTGIAVCPRLAHTTMEKQGQCCCCAWDSVCIFRAWAGTEKGLSRWQWGSVFAVRCQQHSRVYFLMKWVTWLVSSIC